MKKIDLLKEHIKITDIHAQRLSVGIKKISPLLPFTPDTCEHLNNEQIAFFDLTTTRFVKLQNSIGAKIFPLMLELLGEDAHAFIDKLNKLEKLGYLEDADWWMELREIRNEIAHDYPHDYSILARQANKFFIAAQDLLIFWNNLKIKIQLLISQSE